MLVLLFSYLFSGLATKRYKSCAHLYNLRRIGVGVFNIGQSIDIDKLELLASSDPKILSHELKPIDSFINHWPSLQLKVQQEVKFLSGQAIELNHLNFERKNEYLVRVYGFSNNFLGTGRIVDDRLLCPKRLIAN